VKEDLTGGGLTGGVFSGRPETEEPDIKIIEKPKLNDPAFIAAWPGMGNVAMTTVTYLKDQLGAKYLGELEVKDFFAPTGALVSRQVVKTLSPPKNQFYYHQSMDGNKDILFFIGSVQPIPHKEYEFAVEVLKVAKQFKVQRIYTTAAAPSDMHFKDTPRVFAVPTNTEELKRLLKYKVHFMGDGSIAGLNGLLLSVALELDMEGLCLLGEIPFSQPDRVSARLHRDSGYTDPYPGH